MKGLFINVDSILPCWRWNALAGIRRTVKLCDEKTLSLDLDLLDISWEIAFVAS